MSSSHVPTLSCPDLRGVVATVTRYLAANCCSIVEAHQHQSGGRFFMRVQFDIDPDATIGTAMLAEQFAPIAEQHAIAATFRD